jgi:hypothetical protein
MPGATGARRKRFPPHEARRSVRFYFLGTDAALVGRHTRRRAVPANAHPLPGPRRLGRIAITPRSSAAVRRSRASTSMLVAPEISRNRFARRKIGPAAGPTATPSRKVTVLVNSSCVRTHSGSIAHGIALATPHALIVHTPAPTLDSGAGQPRRRPARWSRLRSPAALTSSTRVGLDPRRRPARLAGAARATGCQATATLEPRPTPVVRPAGTRNGG